MKWLARLEWSYMLNAEDVKNEMQLVKDELRASIRGFYSEVKERIEVVRKDMKMVTSSENEAVKEEIILLRTNMIEVLKNMHEVKKSNDVYKAFFFAGLAIAMYVEFLL
ncbi:conserved hypothetical protein [Ricinus communis]|uniref:Uncharacterized protein n=1 Tax=Ricinus communis TaxID=3988 RepID=B9SQ48_RICCO|nr:conserved hypothetical protein [Ricinus communis]